MHAIRMLTGAVSLKINPLYNSLGTWLRSQINPAAVWFINPHIRWGIPFYLLLFFLSCKGHNALWRTVMTNDTICSVDG